MLLYRCHAVRHLVSKRLVWFGLHFPPPQGGMERELIKKMCVGVGRNVSLLHGYDGVTSGFEKDKIIIIITYKLPMLMSQWL